MAVIQIPPQVRSSDEQARALRVTRRQAGALLAAVSLVFLGVTIAGAEGGLGYVQATAEAAMVGGLADWFAVTALFRHPLGIPIPHTAIISTRKDRFGATLGSFIAESFLTPETIVERVRSSKAAERTMRWLTQPANARKVAGYVLDGAVQVADLLRDDEIQTAIEHAVRSRIESIEVTPLAGRLLASATRDGRHEELVDATLRGLSTYLDENRVELKLRLEQASPWWLPGAVEDRIFSRLVDGARNVLDDMVNDRGHDMRQHLEERVAKLIDDLQHDPEFIARGETIKQELLDLPALRDFVGTAWGDLKEGLRSQAADPESLLRARLADSIASTAQRFSDDPALIDKVQDGLEIGVHFVVTQFDEEIAGVVTHTIARWDGAETARRLELLLGPDLQYIRINGTIVGGLAGLVLHTVAETLG
ncbi:MAG TPA: DUF445 domain-containing protein [Acidimicrobiales bacterium]|nr:DUF445 domain-containing protein [Acidimicrobiales bacterium]